MNRFPNDDYCFSPARDSASDSLKVIAPSGVDNRYYRLATNPVALPCADKKEDPSEEILRVRQYLLSVLNRGYCPFVPDIEKANGYHVSVCDQDPATFNVDRVIQRLAGSFRRHIAECHPGVRESALTFIQTFSHPDAASERFLDTMRKMKNRHRIPLMEKGLKFEVAHPRIQPEGSKLLDRQRKTLPEPLFVSPIPLIMMRAFHRADLVFMKTQRDMEVYRRFFETEPREAWESF